MLDVHRTEGAFAMWGKTGMHQYPFLCWKEQLIWSKLLGPTCHPPRRKWFNSQLWDQKLLSPVVESCFWLAMLKQRMVQQCSMCIGQREPLRCEGGKTGIYIYIYIYIFIYLYIHIHTHIYIYICLHIYINNIYIYTLNIYIYIYTLNSIYTYTYTYDICIYVVIYIYIHIIYHISNNMLFFPWESDTQDIDAS